MTTRTHIRDVLRPLDPNQSETPVKENEFKSPFGMGTTAKTSATPKRTAVPNAANLLSPLPIKQRKNFFKSPQYKSRKQQFHLVCAERVAEDIDGDLCELGIQEWAVDDFVYQRKLGHGGTAHVYLASEKQSGYKVALKIQETDDNAFCEIDIHDKLDHPNIVRMIDYFYSFTPFRTEEEDQGWEDGPTLPHNPEEPFLYMILEVCDGGSLHDKIDNAPNGRIPEQQAAKYFLDAVRALEYIHAQGMLHCDCKPANFLLDLDDRVKLADFGMAVHEEEKEVVGGSPVYMAPEHLMAWRQMTDDFDHRSDIYSLGVVLYEMLEGVLPYIVWEAPKMNLESSVPAPIYDSDDEELFPILDLRKLFDMSSEEPFYVPPPLFLAEISEEAEDLVTRLMEPSASERISLSEAKDHPWLKKFNL
ncbi:unnamed protein product [Cylindrotheca closterium]|uniref:Protein kinase domain-containing protein n=1 Tax=Cylindrotheca closterium TaxID=2856 RepID=A0AAD2JII0_9STRA|nr:unnamed protein product [Cylindrotheca closterium]CAJ1954006.1 unnamed protein product [Cylindrotheca closterium]CAJ1954012.1 unnamed protein product [Cylindrotheca closterium]